QWHAKLRHIADALHKIGIVVPGIRRSDQRPAGPALRRLTEIQNTVGRELSELIRFGFAYNDAIPGFSTDSLELRFRGYDSLYLHTTGGELFVDVVGSVLIEPFDVTDHVWCRAVEQDLLDEVDFHYFQGREIGTVRLFSNVHGGSSSICAAVFSF